MKTVRRLYFYAVAAISLEAVLWGLINLLRSIVDQTVGGGAIALAQALALVLVGVPIFLIHWLWAQRASARDEDEKTSIVRALFLYGVLLGTLIPLIQNLLALIDRTFLQAVHIGADRAIVGGLQTWPDNLIAILMNAIVAAYFWNILRGEWRTLPRKENFADIRRVYRYVWVLDGLSLMVLGAQQILSFMFNVPSDVLGDIGRETIINGIALMVVGTPIWFFAWRIIQDSLSEESERDSNLRLGVLYLLALAGVITVLTAAAMLVNVFITKLLGMNMATADFVYQIGGPISVGVPLGVVWAYYGRELRLHIESIGDSVRQCGMTRVQFYVLSVLGLGGAFLGVTLLIKFMIDLLTAGALVLTDTLRSNLAAAISLIVAWLPLWLLTWRPMQRQALAADEMAVHARRSVVRKAYLYLALFAGVIGGMIAAVALVFELLRALLTGQTDSTFLSTILNEFQVLVLFSVLLLYHWTVLRRDGLFTADSLARKQSEFKVLVVDSAAGFSESVRSALAKTAPSVPVTIASEKPRGQFNALILSGSTAINSPDWVRAMSGERIIVPDEMEGVVWAGGVPRSVFQQAAQVIRQLSEGQKVRKQAAGTSGWVIVGYVAAALFGLQILTFLLLLTFTAFMH
jgi:Domain of unknown function (DUF5671)